MIPRLKLSVSSEKNIYNSPDAVVDGSSGVIDTDSFKVQSTYFEIALPFILNNTSAGQPFH